MVAEKPPLKILMLHGFTQSGPLFRAKTRALEKHLQKSFPLHTIILSYPSGPIRLDPSDIPNFRPSSSLEPYDQSPQELCAWWRRADGIDPPEYLQLDHGLETVASLLRAEGPFDGVIGFSQGAAFAAMLAGLLEDDGRKASFEYFSKPENNSSQVTRASGTFALSTTAAAAAESQRRVSMGTVSGVPFPRPFADLSHPPFKFAICYSGFRAPGARYRAFYERPAIRTPILHVLGSLDAIVDEGRSRFLIESCAGEPEKEGKVVWHPGGHFLPCQRPYLDAAVKFIRSCLELGDGREEKSGKGAGGKLEGDVPVEDMVMPF
ncbi:Family of serine hydrolases 3 [Emydomyces testavorans]|uniref:Family of serine hydrolases 3 n=1 Tax=Emydomyces testavorans TaxID=2070801 RepID=A0AAF0DFD1_9EURO|nr:Family of serine hydrolases 3 [Emydomyces testavorans]